MIKLCLDVKDVIHANEHTKYANSGLHVNFWKFWLMPFCFMIKKDHFKQNYYFGLRPTLKNKKHSGTSLLLISV